MVGASALRCRCPAAFRGHVQGVGFRYTVKRVSGRFDVVGFVKNQADGSVQLVVEGPSSQLDEFLTAVNGAMQGYIQDVQATVGDSTGEFAGFEIRF